MHVPVAQAVGPVYPLPPHCPHKVCPPAAAVVVTGAFVVDVTFVVVRVVFTELVTPTVLVVELFVDELETDGKDPPWPLCPQEKQPVVQFSWKKAITVLS